MVTSNRIHQWAEEILRRVSPEGPWVVRHRLRRALALMRRLGLALLAMSAVLFAACLMALFFTPLGLKGLLVTPLLMLAVGGIVLFWPARRTPGSQTIDRRLHAASMRRIQ